jgi:hypothetical protein
MSAERRSSNGRESLCLAALPLTGEAHRLLSGGLPNARRSSSKSA